MTRPAKGSGYSGDNCIEIAPDLPATVPVRDTKTPDGPVLFVSHRAWSAFLAGVRHTA